MIYVLYHVFSVSNKWDLILTLNSLTLVRPAKKKRERNPTWDVLQSKIQEG